MPAPLSIVIPTLNAAEALPATLDALVEGLAAGLIRDLVISDGGSEDATLAIAETSGARVVRGEPGRGGQLRRGVAAARGDWVLLLHADTELPPGWPGLVGAHLGEAPDTAGYFRLAFRAGGFFPWLTAAWANLRSKVFGMPYGDQGLLVRQSTLKDVGGVPDLPLMEDVALARALRGQLRMLPGTAVTSAARYTAEGWMRRGTRNLWIFARFQLGADPAALARAYSKRR